MSDKMTVEEIRRMVTSTGSTERGEIFDRWLKENNAKVWDEPEYEWGVQHPNSNVPTMAADEATAREFLRVHPKHPYRIVRRTKQVAGPWVDAS